MSRSSRQRSANLPEVQGTSPGPAHSISAVTHSVEFSSYAGPLPHPDILRGFEEVVPGSAERIVKQFEQQSSHRRSMEATVISSGAFSQRLGTASALLIGLVGVAGGLWLTHEGRSVVGLTSFLGTLAGLIGTYLYQRKQQDREREEKRGSREGERK